MMSKFSRWLVFFLAGVFCLAGCSSLEVVSGLQAPPATYVLSVPGATITPTPFQPLAPTPVVYPTNAYGELLIPTSTLPGASMAENAPPVTNLQEQEALARLPDQLNVLLLGVDKRPWETQFRTDTIILVTLNKDLGSVNITSFPRDLYVTLPGWGMGRINTAYTFGQYDLLYETFGYNFGVRPDYHILINFESFKKTIDSLGGLDVQVGETLSDYRYGYWTTIQAGLVHMDADTVLWYARSRKTSNDFARNRRQQEVLQAIFEKLLSMDALKRAPEFYQVYKNNVDTDFGLADLLAWLPLAAKIAETRNIHQFYIGAEQVYDWISPEGGMVLLPNQDALMQVIRQSQNLP